MSQNDTPQPENTPIPEHGSVATRLQLGFLALKESVYYATGTIGTTVALEQLHLEPISGALAYPAAIGAAVAIGYSDAVRKRK